MNGDNNGTIWVAAVGGLVGLVVSLALNSPWGGALGQILFSLAGIAVGVGLFLLIYASLEKTRE